MIRPMIQTLVILVVGLAPNLVGPHTPNLARLAAKGAMRPLKTVTPAVTCTVQSTLLTGLAPSGHGVVANGWYFRDLAEVWLWRQSNRLVAGEKIWEAGRARDPGFTCAKMGEPNANGGWLPSHQNSLFRRIAGETRHQPS